LQIAAVNGGSNPPVGGTGMRGNVDGFVMSVLASLSVDDRQRARKCVRANWSQGWGYWATGCTLLFVPLVFGFLGASVVVQTIGGKYAVQLGILVGFLALIPVEPLVTRLASEWRLRRPFPAKLGINFKRSSARLLAGAAVNYKPHRTTRRPRAARLRR
jgi:hypothetical protein